jgi:hypothetical protein
MHRIIANAGVYVTVEDRPSPTLSEVQRLLDERGGPGVTAYDPQWLAAFSINDRKVVDYRAGRIFLAGDAAHIQSPVGGQGMNTGMQDAFNLAWKLALVCRGTGAEEPLLGSYSTERSAIGDQVLANASRLTAIAVMKNHTAQVVRNLLGGVLFGLTRVQRAMADTLSEVTLGYSQSPLNGAHGRGLGGPAPGERAPLADEQTPVGAGDAPRFALFAAPSEASGRLLRDYPNLVEPTLRPPLASGGMWLARPDGYVACAVWEADAAAIGDWLGALAHR